MDPPRKGRGLRGSHPTELTLMLEVCISLEATRLTQMSRTSSEEVKVEEVREFWLTTAAAAAMAGVVAVDAAAAWTLPAFFSLGPVSDLSMSVWAVGGSCW